MNPLIVTDDQMGIMVNARQPNATFYFPTLTSNFVKPLLNHNRIHQCSLGEVISIFKTRKLIAIQLICNTAKIMLGYINAELWFLSLEDFLLNLVPNESSLTWKKKLVVITFWICNWWLRILHSLHLTNYMLYLL